MFLFFEDEVLENKTCSFLMGKPTLFAVNGYKDLIIYSEQDN